MALLEEIDGMPGRLTLECPGCKMMHVVNTQDYQGTGPKWAFNGNYDKPTFSPSILVTWDVGEERKQFVCHSFVREGQWHFLNDCTHALAGQIVDMIDVE